MDAEYLASIGPFRNWANKDLRGVDLNKAQKTWLGMVLCTGERTLTSLCTEYRLEPKVLHSYALAFQQGGEYKSREEIMSEFNGNDVESILETIVNSGREPEDVTDDEMTDLIAKRLASDDHKNSI